MSLKVQEEIYLEYIVNLNKAYTVVAQYRQTLYKQILLRFRPLLWSLTY